MASTMTAAHAPAVNHPTQRTAGFSATHSAAAGHFTTDAVRHGNETVRSTLSTASGTVAGVTGWVAAHINPVTGKQVFVPNGAAGVPGTDPSYTYSNGVYTFNGNSAVPGLATSASTLAGAMAAWLANNPTATTTTTTGGGTSTPFDTLATLLTNLSGQTPVAAAVPDDTPGTSVPTTSSPSLVIPLLLVLLACGVGYWWYTKHHKKKHATAAAH